MATFIKFLCVLFVLSFVGKVKPVDPSVLSKSGNECLVNNGVPVAPSSSLSFTYAWDTSFSFQPLSSQINCS
uniref:Uncharacterized protein n=1 Tax=Quercus lobata TaxID=97700 RepID=A0A7N2N368_QUELO